MLKQMFIGVGIILGLCAFGVDKGDILYQNDCDNAGAFGEKYQGHYRSGEGLAKDGAFHMTGFNGSNFMIVPLDPQKINGLIVFEAVVKADNISKPEKEHLGAKLMLVVKDKSGNTQWLEPSMLKRSGSYDWETVSMQKNLPAEPQSVELYFGVQSATGDFWIDSLSVYRGKQQ